MRPNKSMERTEAGGSAHFRIVCRWPLCWLVLSVRKHSDFMTYRTSLILAVLSAAILCGCSKHPAHEALTSSASIAIEPGVSIGPVHSRMKKQDVVAVLGEPKHEHGGVLEYRDLGISLLPGKEGFLECVVCSGGNDKFKPFTGHTKENIGIGSSRADVISAYGEPTTTREGRGVPEESTLVYKRRGINFHIQDDKVSMIAVFLNTRP